MKGTFTLIPLPKIDELFALLKELGTLQHLTSALVTTTSNWMKSQSKKCFHESFQQVWIFKITFQLSQGPNFFILLIYDLFRLNKTSNKSQGSGYLAYLEDILIYSKTEKEHLEILNDAFKHLPKASLKIKLTKCSFLRNKSII